MIDCHTHLASDDFESDRRDVISRAEKAGIEKIIVVGEDYEDSIRVLEICGEYPGFLYPCIGFHPDRFSDDLPVPGSDEVERLCNFIREKCESITAIGEVGLDYTRASDKNYREYQNKFLAQIVDLSKELNLPLNIHSRSAGHYALDILYNGKADRVLMHAFSGKASYAKRAFEQYGYFFSIPPSVVYSNQKQKLIRSLPLEALVLETDSPVLGPERGVRNEPNNIIYSTMNIAKIKGISEDKVREITTANAINLFKF
jgi:TatD DNase family protein